MRKVTDLGEKDLIHCPTYEEAKQIRALILGNHFKRTDGEYWSGTDYHKYEKNTCYSPKLGRTIGLEFNELVDGKIIPVKEFYNIIPASEFLAPEFKEGEYYGTPEGLVVKCSKTSEAYNTVFDGEVVKEGSYNPKLVANVTSWSKDNFTHLADYNKKPTMKTLEFKRRTFQSTYILDAALWNPNVVIVCLNTYHVEALKYRYEKMKKETPWLKRIALKLFGKNQNFTPVFLSLNQCGEFFSPIVPVLIDNSVKLVGFPMTEGEGNG